MKTLILGSQGNLGTQLMEVIPEAIGWDRTEFDFLDFPLLKEKILELKPDVIVNAVAYNMVDNCEINAADYDLALKLNRDLVSVLAEQPALLVHYSTDYVFSGSLEKQEFSEADIPDPLNKYGDSKLAGERELITKAKKYYLIRTSKLFGPQGLSAYAKPSFFDIMLNLAQTKDELDVVDEEVSCFTYTPDLAQATAELIISKAPTGIYHIVNPGALTWYQAAFDLFKLKKLSINIKALSSEALARPARRPKYSILKNTKLKPLRNYREALKEYLQ